MELSHQECIDFASVLWHYNDMSRCMYPNCALTAMCWYEHNCGTLTTVCFMHQKDFDHWVSHGEIVTCKVCHGTCPVPIPWRPM